MLSDERELPRMRDGVRRLLALAAIAAGEAAITIGYRGTTLEDCQTDAAIGALLLAEASDAQHASGGCRMGRPDDPRTVVDPRRRVLGLERPRVIDASIVPEAPRAKTHLSRCW